MTTLRATSDGDRVRSPLWLPRPGLRAAVAVFSAAVGVAALLAVRDTTTWGTTYAGAAPEAAIADLAAGLGLIAAGLFVGVDRSLRRLGTVVMLLGAAWLSADLVGWQDASPSLRILATAWALFTLPLLLDIVVTAPGRRSASRALRGLVLGSYMVAGAIAVGLVLALDPLSDSDCWDLCSANPFLLSQLGGLEPGLVWSTVVLTIVGGAAVGLMAAVRLIGASGPARHDLRPILGPGLVVGILLAARAFELVVGDFGGPTDAPSMVLFQATAWALVALAAGVVLVARRRRRIRTSVRAIAMRGADDSATRSVERALSAATGDEGLQVAYPLSDGGGWVNAAGLPVEPTNTAGRVLTSIARTGDTIAVVKHDPDAINAAELIEHIGPAVALTLENERLDAELLARLRALRASRARIVAAADRERIRRERSLHDGAQQRLLALTYDLRAARAAVDQSDVRPAIEPLDEAIVAVHAAHDELRDLAHGIYPAVLGEAGLRPALEGLAERSHVPLRLDLGELGRCDPGAEMTAYVISDELMRDATDRSASRASLRAARDGGLLVLDVEDDGRVPHRPIVHGVDRAEAVGGHLTVRSDDRGAVSHRLEVPCASS